MEFSWDALVVAFNRLAPEGTPRRKLAQIVAIVLLFEGISVLVLFSKAGLFAGLLSITLGILLLVFMHPFKRGRSEAIQKVAAPAAAAGEARRDPPGVILVDALMHLLRSDYVVMALGFLIIVAILVFNAFLSDRPDLGDLDTLSIMLGGMIMVYPMLAKRFKIEACFSLIFLGLVVVFLVLPQAVTSMNKGNGSSIGNWYVQYMLAAPFAGILNLVGIPASSSGSVVVIEFHDGTLQALGISAYCAGLYSFSIFLAAFFSFVLVFERLRTPILAVVMGLGLLVAFLGNLFRMVIIGIVGYYRGLDALLWAHENVGWIIFLSWSALFWYFLLGYVSKQQIPAECNTEVN
jgi:archaeosortase C (PEF-CTERM variant)